MPQGFYDQVSRLSKKEGVLLTKQYKSVLSDIADDCANIFKTIRDNYGSPPAGYLSYVEIQKSVSQELWSPWAGDVCKTDKDVLRILQSLRDILAILMTRSNFFDDEGIYSNQLLLGGRRIRINPLTTSESFLVLPEK